MKGTHTYAMDALVWLGPRKMELRHEPVPSPGPGEVLVEVAAVGICGSELSGYLGQNSLRRPPLIMGHEAAGRIAFDSDASLSHGSPARAGTRVTINPLLTCGACDLCQSGKNNLCRHRQLIGAHRPGAFAGYVAVPAHLCVPLPDHVSLTLGSLTEPLACGVRAVAHADAPQRLVILGAGPIGLLCLIAARAAGVERVLVSDVSERRLAMARAWGATATVNARDNVLAAVQAFAPGGADAAIDAVGLTVTRDQAVRAVTPGGRAVLIGLHEEESVFAANHVVRQEITVVGSFAYSDTDFQRALDLLAMGRVSLDGDWLEERPLAAGPAAFEELIAGATRAVKIVLQVEE
ncbi:MAG: galactitol-1-phosphate 5-dehydrogenase [Roseiflexus sp.]|nr:galactitol-1-phosphate 5-dehydrogenase [Roseiflexus sp.]MCS7290337.1 galactitol-1-phosphate 5-dehydrogenase [Roseiflexus sp.]MDW8146091.1 galactitol-1-phosphate 5-dehydrogenase [Roseiflexaceae bacterium]MDW8231247.1 galactitol-1-phosphate 5-dehydrogenase [Roseiflexaceae bacterium]